MISREDARAIVYHLDAARLARRVWREAARSLAMEAGEKETGEAGDVSFRMAAVVLDLEDGTLRVESHRSEGGVQMDENLVVLVYADRVLVEDTTRRISAGCELPPSAEVMAEEVACAIEGDGLGISWRAVEKQLRLAYATATSEAREPHEGGR